MSFDVSMLIFRRILAALSFFLCLSVFGGARADTPLSLDGVSIVDAKTVALMLQSSDTRLVDTRALHDFLAGHLPNALHVDYRERSSRDIAFDMREDDAPLFLARLEKFVKPHQAVVFYCNGPACWKSYKAAVVARNAKYRNIYWFRGGLTDWRQEGRTVVTE